MKIKVIKKLLLGCMTVAALFCTPVACLAEEGQVSEIEVTLNNIHPVIYEDNRTSVSLIECSYTEGASDIVLYFGIENNNPKILEIEFSDIMVDDANINLLFGNKDEYKAGANVGSCQYISLEDLEAINMTDFNKLSFTISGMFNDGTKLFKENVVILRESFKSLYDEEPTEENETQNTESESESTTENGSNIIAPESELESEIEELKEINNSLESKNADLQEQIETLTSENSELKEKVASLESENEKLKETNDKLKQENEELKSSQNETVSEEIPKATAEPESTEVSQESVEPVIEYEDSTTIRIVQQTLNEVGYNCGAPDGISGGKTSQAITSYQTAKGITVNGLITDELLESLGIVEKVQEAIKAEGEKNEYSADYTYDQLARNPDTYIGQKVKIYGKVLQAETSDDMCYARVAMNSNYDTVIFVTYDKDILGYRLLDDDMVTVYGTSFGVYSYDAVSGATITIPWLHANIIEM